MEPNHVLKFDFLPIDPGPIDRERALALLEGEVKALFPMVRLVWQHPTSRIRWDSPSDLECEVNKLYDGCIAALRGDPVEVAADGSVQTGWPEDAATLAELLFLVGHEPDDGSPIDWTCGATQALIDGMAAKLRDRLNFMAGLERSAARDRAKATR